MGHRPWCPHNLWSLVSQERLGEPEEMLHRWRPYPWGVQAWLGWRKRGEAGGGKGAALMAQVRSIRGEPVLEA